MQTRRTFISGAVAASAAGLVPTRISADVALGSASVTTISDGHLVLPGDFVFGPMPKDELAPILDAYGVSATELTPECNVVLFRDGTNTVLFDAGSGSSFMPSAGDLAENLDAAGVAPEEITHVVITHGHPDHIWGLLDDFDDPMFSEASYFMGRVEWDYWYDPKTVDAIGPERAAFAVGAKRRLEVIEDAVTFFDDGDELLPGISAVSSPGHTFGHMSFELRDGSESLMVLGDAVVNHHVAFRMPEWPSGSDQDQTLAARTRTQLLDRVAADDMRIVGFHLPQGGLGRAERHDGAYRFVPEAG